MKNSPVIKVVIYTNLVLGKMIAKGAIQQKIKHCIFLVK